MDAKNVSAAKPKIGGSVFVAPLGTKLPEDAKSELDAKFNSLGYCSDDGVSNNNSPETDTQKAWGGAVVLNLFSGKEDTFKLKLIESLNVNVLKTVYGSSNVTGDLDTGLTIKAKNEEPEQFSSDSDIKLVSDNYAMYDGWGEGQPLPTQKNVSTLLGMGFYDAVTEGCITRESITEIGEIKYSDSDAIGYEITFSGVPDETETSHYDYMIKKKEGE